MDPWRQRLGGRGQGAGRQEAEEIRMFNHWATGLRSGLLPEGCGVAAPEVSKKSAILDEIFVRVLIFCARGKFFEGFW